MNWNGNRAMVLTREFERANPFEEIFPPRLTDSLGNDVLQNMLEMCALQNGGFEGRFDKTEPLQSLLQKLYDLRQRSEAEEWPMPAEPIHEEVQP